jgi:hypothetical protein
VGIMALFSMAALAVRVGPALISTLLTAPAVAEEPAAGLTVALAVQVTVAMGGCTAVEAAAEGIRIMRAQLGRAATARKALSSSRTCPKARRPSLSMHLSQASF